MRNAPMAARREASTEGSGLDLYDVLTSGSLFLPRPPERRAAGRLFADESQKWPDTLWETVTRDPTLSW
ncbi:hypothetical protein [Streptomyces glaucescens]|uniref:hypothetical protein n=1 Tax=Streptomyces glaucescens TaxID=1907 RepID=UPI000A39CC54|nr:hypothetical protein [Streptomyces glaucescens]